MFVPTLAVAAATPDGQLLGLLAAVPFDEHLACALRWRHEHLNDIESGGRWTADAEAAVLHAFVRGDQGAQVDFDVRFDLSSDREVLKAAGHTGRVLLAEDAQGGRPTREHLVHNALEIANVPADALAIAVRSSGR